MRSERTRKINGQTPGDDGEPSMPTAAQPDRHCDFCDAVSTTHWLTFHPARRNEGLVLPGYLGACATCAATIDFSNADQVAALGNQPDDIAEFLAGHFKTITAGT